MSVREDIETIDNATHLSARVLDAWHRVRDLIPVPEQTAMDQFLEFSVGQKFVTPDASMYTFVKVGEISAVQVRKSDGNPKYYEDMFAEGAFANWVDTTMELTAVED